MVFLTQSLHAFLRTALGTVGNGQEESWLSPVALSVAFTFITRRESQQALRIILKPSQHQALSLAWPVWPHISVPREEPWLSFWSLMAVLSSHSGQAVSDGTVGDWCSVGRGHAARTQKEERRPEVP